MNKIEALKNKLSPIAGALAGMKRESPKSQCGPCPKCGGNDRFVYREDLEKFFCRQCHQKMGDVAEYHCWMEGISLSELIRRHFPKDRVESSIHIEDYVYRDAGGKDYLKISRFLNTAERKKYFLPYRINGSGWSSKPGLGNDFQHIPYNLETVIKSDEILIVEGEKCVNELVKHGFSASCNDGGACKWRPELNQHFAGKKIVILPDSDEPGLKHAEQVAQHLSGVAASVKVIHLPDLPPGGDVVDFFDSFTDKEAASERLSILIDGAAPWEPAAEKETTKTSTGFKLVHIGTISPKPNRWMIRGLIESDTLILIFGDPESGKSFAAVDIACCVASGVDFHGYETKHKGPVIYIAGEGQNGLSRRFKAWSIRHQIDMENIPVFCSLIPAGLCDGEQTEAVCHAIHEIAKQHGEPALIIIDTLARNFGPGDENSTSDMTSFIASLDRIRSLYRSAVLPVHHSGHGDKTRARGSMALKGALDTEFKMSRDVDDNLLFECTKAKDFERPEPIAFRLRSVDLGYVDEDDEPVTSAILDEVDMPMMGQPKGKQGRGKWQQVALDCLDRLQQDHRRNLEASGYDPNSARVTVTEWQDVCRNAGMHRETWRRIREKPPTGVKIINGFVEC